MQPSDNATIENGSAENGIHPASPAPAKLSSTRRGKVARLPHAIREELNQRLRDGEAADTLLAWLNGLPEVRAILTSEFAGQPLNKQNLSEWRRGGYQDWAARQTVSNLLASLDEDALAHGLAEKMSQWLAIRYAVAARNLMAAGDAPGQWAQLRELGQAVAALRRGDHRAERLRLAEARLKQEHTRSKEEIDKEFWAWAERPEIQRQLYPPPLSNEEMVRKMAAIFGIEPTRAQLLRAREADDAERERERLEKGIPESECRTQWRTADRRYKIPTRLPGDPPEVPDPRLDLENLRGNPEPDEPTVTAADLDPSFRAPAPEESSPVPPQPPCEGEPAAPSADLSAIAPSDGGPVLHSFSEGGPTPVKVSQTKKNVCAPPEPPPPQARSTRHPAPPDAGPASPPNAPVAPNSELMAGLLAVDPDARLQYSPPSDATSTGHEIR